MAATEEMIRIALATKYGRYGYRRITALLNNQKHWRVNHKRVYRLYQQEGLMMRPKRHRRHVTGCRRMEAGRGRGT
jgi:hypothetical protein